jgi:hypothetical protein
MMSRFLQPVIIVAIAVGTFLNVLAQSGEHPIDLKPGQKALAGKWRLIGTTVQGQFHEVRKNEFDAVITLRPHHKYQEEVFYESNHWIITGKWTTDFNNDTLTITSRAYIVGSNGKTPEDIILHLLWLNTTEWAGEGTQQGQPVKLYYKKLIER